MTNERKDKIVTAAAEQFRALLETRYEEIVKAATDSFIDHENTSEPRCKVNAAVEWDALATTAKVSVKLSWSAKFKDESETEVDIDQLTIADLEDKR